LENKEINPTSRQDIALPTIISVDSTGNKNITMGYLNSFSNYPATSISGFLFFKFPINKQENVVSEIVEYRYS